MRRVEVRMPIGRRRYDDEVTLFLLLSGRSERSVFQQIPRLSREWLQTWRSLQWFIDSMKTLRLVARVANIMLLTYSGNGFSLVKSIHVERG